MSNMFFVVCIVAIACTTAVLTEYFRSRKDSHKKNEDLDDTSAQIDLLEERIKVLERIITENKYDLKREIDKL